MLLTTHIPWIMFSVDSAYFRPVVVPPGEYQMNVIPNPHQPEGQPWIIIDGTSIGLNQQFAMEMSHIHFGDFQLAAHSPERHLQSLSAITNPT